MHLVVQRFVTILEPLLTILEPRLAVLQIGDIRLKVILGRQCSMDSVRGLADHPCFPDGDNEGDSGTA
jgi:hypothetical protein